MNRLDRRLQLGLRPKAEGLEGRALLSVAPDPILRILHQDVPFGAHPERPNTPVLPFAAPSASASFLDPTVAAVHPERVAIGQKVFVAPYAILDGSGGFVAVGNGSDILDHAQVLANPGAQAGIVGVTIGQNVSIGAGAIVRGPATIGGTAAGSKATMIGANALVDGATIQPGAIVGPLARVGPGVTVPAGVYVLPGKNVTTDAQASDPTQGMVRAITSTDTSTLTAILSDNTALASGYTTLYQGNSATGASPGTTTAGINNGSLAAVRGTSAEPARTGVTSQFPEFPYAPARGTSFGGNFYQFPGRITGQATFKVGARNLARHFGRNNSIRADEGQPIALTSVGKTGANLTIQSPGGGVVTIGQNFNAGQRTVILGTPSASTSLGDNVTVGDGAVVTGSTIGAGSVIGARAYVSGSTLPAGTNIPAGQILIGNQVRGSIQW